MKTAIVIYKEIINEYFRNGVSFIPTKNEKLMFSLGYSNDIVMKENIFENEIASFEYTTKKQLNFEFEKVCDEFKNLINPFDLYVI